MSLAAYDRSALMVLSQILEVTHDMELQTLIQF